jgi:large subunit ribosomal protein L29
MPTATELRELDDDELDTRLAEYRRQLLNLRFQMATGQLDNYSRLNEARRDVARILTVLRDREIALAEGRDAGPVVFERPVRPARRRSHTETGDDMADEFEDGDVEDPAVEEVAVDDLDVDDAGETDTGTDEETL